MFRGGQPNPLDDLVTKATDENLTGEDWETILNLCDKVQDDGEQGAQNAIAALLKRLAHRSPNVQLYALSLAEALSKNCGVVLHRELASRVFTQGLERLVTDRTTHDKVRQRALGLIAMWTAEFENDPSLGIMEECYASLEAKNYKFETPNEPPPPAVDDEVRRREEEELQRALEMSLNDRGGRSGYTGSGAASSVAGPSTNTGRTYPSGYVPAKSPPAAASSNSSLPAQTSPAPSAAPAASTPVVTRVRALHTFEATEPGELAFERGDVIRVVDRAYRDWWRGQLRGRTGIFPVNYVEPLPEPTAAELAREAEQEAAIFAQAANVDRLLMLLRDLDSSGERLADNEEIQELYRSCMSLRPKIVKLIDKYSQKRADLVAMNEAFVKARTVFDRMMEESLARHAAAYESPGYGYPVPMRHEYGPQPYGHGYGPSHHEVPLSTPHELPAFAQPYSGYPAPAQSPYPQQQMPYAPVQTLYNQGQAPTQQLPAQEPFQSHETLPQAQAQPQPTQAQSQSGAESQTQTGSSPQSQDGPPYVYNPNATYADPNVQAWAQYYAQGGKDSAGAVYFVSVPGVTDTAEGPAPATEQVQAVQGQEQWSAPEQYGPTTGVSMTLGSQQPTGPTSGPLSPQSAHHGWQPSQQSPYGYVPPQTQPQSPQQYAPSAGISGYGSSPSSASGHAPPMNGTGGHQSPLPGGGYGGGYDYGVGALQHQFADMGVSRAAHQTHAASTEG
ncbi:hypothetical protein BKA82DRAFT_4127005 [Pisolithus tinctorius]|uniref:Class E vacuolar protein-sorting machinery protein HSE1 n=1 Tax=Pisolithus tinctorius Marx 270 TaxID=870435 RepID=A0A0C3J375_PISTI|nr:hypothetical protein BKA82DRAFT_4127005 [Pisolithus tinctorius]KIO03533.1 hypothetical protein M404DRAFT_1001479 [Pisolithus tinctorius Marx 270]